MKTKRTELDSVDLTIVAELKNDGRATNRALGLAVGVSEQTVAARLRRLEESNILKVVAVVGRPLHGYNCRLHFGIQTSGRSPREVGTQLAKIPNVISLAISFGRYELIGVLLAHSDKEALDTITRQFGPVKGIQHLEILVDVEHIHYTINFSRLRGTGSRVPTLPLHVGSTANGLDDGDFAIARELMMDARLSFREVGRRLEVSESYVRSRVRVMQDKKFLRFQAITDISTNPDHWAAYVALQVELVRSGGLDKLSQVFPHAAP